MTAHKCKYFVTTIASVILLSGCSYVPDKLNPIEWASDGYDWLLGEDDYSYSNSNVSAEIEEEQTGAGVPECRCTDFMEWHNCEGTYRFADGDKYVGEFKDGKQHGQGTYTFANGNKYVGVFRDGQKNGQGTYTCANGKKYVGEYRGGKSHGHGTHTWADGRKYVGEYRNGKEHGRVPRSKSYDLKKA